MNTLESLFWFVTAEAADIYAASREKLVQTQRLLAITLIVPILTLIAAMLAGVVGDAAASPFIVSVASGMVVVACLMGSILFAFVWVKAAVYLNILWLASRIGGHFSSSLAFLDRGESEKFVVWFRGITAWFSGAFLLIVLLNSFDPVWRHFGLMGILVGAAAALAAIASSNWFQTHYGRPVFLTITVIVFVFTVARYISPAFAETTKTYYARWFGRSDLSAITEARDAEREAADRKLLDSLLAERNEIIRRGIAYCDGKVCPGDAKRFAEIDTKVASVKNGTNWQVPAPSAAPSTSSSAPAPSASAASPAPPVHRGHVRYVPAPASQSKTDDHTDQAIDSVLDQYRR